jgi:hypothetical protein
MRVIAIGALLALMPFAQGIANQTTARNLFEYEKAGPFSMALKLNSKSRLRLEAEVRDFVWKHWRERRLGYVTFTKFSKEGESSKSDVFIEPDQEGSWRVAVRVERVVVDRASKRRQRSAIEYSAYSLERIDPGLRVNAEAIVIPDTAVKNSASYRLVLKNKDGTELTRL